VGYTLLLKDDALSTCERSAMKEKIIRKITISITKTTHLEQAILPGAHTPLIGVSTPYLYCGTSAVLFWLLPSSLLGEPLPLLTSGGDFLALRSHDLESLSPL